MEVSTKIVLIQDLNCFGHPTIKTPNIDKVTKKRSLNVLVGSRGNEIYSMVFWSANLFSF
jgi:hypothetical protein